MNCIQWIIATERADLTYIRGKKFIISADLALSRHHFIHIGIHAPEMFSFTDLVLFMYYRHFPEIWLEVRSNAVALLRFRSFWKFSLHISIKKKKICISTNCQWFKFLWSFRRAYKKIIHFFALLDEKLFSINLHITKFTNLI